MNLSRQELRLPISNWSRPIFPPFSEGFAWKAGDPEYFPSLDTGVCAASVRKFNKLAAELPGTVVLAVSKDLPFAHARFCTVEGIENVVPVSDFRKTSFDESYGVLMTDGPLKGLLARSVVVIDGDGKVVYTELVPEITQEPDYDKALAAVKR